MGGAAPARSSRGLWVAATVYVAGLCAIAAVNVTLDPLLQFGGGALPPAVQPARAEKVESARRFRPGPELLVLGSSRTMALEPEYIRQRSGRRTFNASVNSARAEDYLAWLRFSRELGWRPEVIVLGVDVEALHDHVPPDARLVHQPELGALVDLDVSPLSALEAALSWQTSSAAARSALRALRGTPPPPANFGADGTNVRHEPFPGQVGDAKIRRSIAEYRARFRGYEALDERRTEELATFIREATDAGIQVVAFVTPLHPRLRADAELSARYDPLLRDTLAWLAARPEVELHRFETIAGFDGDPALFWDGAHLHETNARRLIDRLVEESDALQ